jgi:hypothetical protein
MIEEIVFLWLLLIIFIDIRVRAVEKRINEIEKKLLKREGNKNDSEVINS